MRKNGWMFFVLAIVYAVASALAYWLAWRYYDVLTGVIIVLEVVVLAAYLVSLLSWTIWLTRLSDSDLARVGFIQIAVGLLIFVFSWLVWEYPREFFAISRRLIVGKSLAEYDPRYVTNWIIFSLPFYLIMLNGTTFALILASLSISATRLVQRWGHGGKRVI